MRTFILTIGFIAGCTSIDSADIKTHGIKPSMSISSSDQQANSHVDVTFHVGDSPTTFVNLNQGETVVASTDTPVTLNEYDVLGVTGYAGDLATKAPGTTVTINVTRVDNDSAPASTVTMTEQLALTAPAPGGSVSRANDDVAVSWTSDASEDGVTVSWSGLCVDDDHVDVAPPAKDVTIAKGKIKKKTGDNIDDNCDITFSATRTRTGTLDPAFGGGTIRHSFTSSAKLTSTP